MIALVEAWEYSERHNRRGPSRCFYTSDDYSDRLLETEVSYKPKGIWLTKAHESYTRWGYGGAIENDCIYRVDDFTGKVLPP